MEKKLPLIEKRLITRWLLGLLLLMLPVSLSGMELFGWLVAFVGLGAMVKVRVRKTARFQLQVGPDWFLWGLLAVAIVGAILSEASPEVQRLIVGDFRWVLLLYGYSYFLKWFALNREIDCLTPLLFKVLIPVAIIASLYGLFQVLTGVDPIRMGKEVHFLSSIEININRGYLYRATGFFNNPMTYSHSFVLWFCVFLAQLLIGKLSNNQKVLLTTALGVTGLALLLSLTRGVWISGTVGGFVMLWLWCRRRFWKILVAFMVAVVAVITTFTPLRKRLLSSFDTQFSSNKQRMVLWRANWEISKDHPIFGIGHMENYRRLDEYFIKLGIDPETAFHSHAHNIYLEFLAGTGVLGLFCFLGILVYFIVLAYKLWKKIPSEDPRDRALALGALGALVSLAVGGLTENNFNDSEVAHSIIFIMATIVALAYKHLGSTRLSVKP